MGGPVPTTQRRVARAAGYPCFLLSLQGAPTAPAALLTDGCDGETPNFPSLHFPFYKMGIRAAHPPRLAVRTECDIAQRGKRPHGAGHTASLGECWLRRRSCHTPGRSGGFRLSQLTLDPYSLSLEAGSLPQFLLYLLLWPRLGKLLPSPRARVGRGFWWGDGVCLQVDLLDHRGPRSPAPSC